MEMMNAGKNVSQDDMSIFLNPTVNLSVALSATALIIGAGVLAGYFPARKAVKITAIFFIFIPPFREIQLNIISAAPFFEAAFGFYFTRSQTCISLSPLLA